ncbi:MAG: ABC transporter permease [Gammaproteobacteria bacterium]|nr:ABC transporter permease [Gammaproteobacteria bacterium]
MLKRTIATTISGIFGAATLVAADGAPQAIWIYGDGPALCTEPPCPPSDGSQVQILTPADAADIAGNVPNVDFAAMTYTARMVVRIDDAELEATVIAAERMVPMAELSDGAIWPVESGMSLTEADSLAGARVAVIGRPIRNALFGADVVALGEQFALGGWSFGVKGVLAPHPPFVGVDLPLPDKVAEALATRLYIPFATGAELLFNAGAPLAHIRVTVEDQARIHQTAAAIRARLEGRHGGTPAIEVLNTPPAF